ncbi:hypothetical protein AU468_00625 [Alkalispirochaeta sphaeroplastigenens]|uniref:Uncharacterized protein n=1 Tax=Alkalispirochaeta sphaeroplastigenens TaxID=1187066 RepID=A0A2S4K0W8_9SPIO|nr:hypothetical protein AU468_00625 [Alkalispirochaeta sphaeroplastigenens]
MHKQTGCPRGGWSPFEKNGVAEGTGPLRWLRFFYVRPAGRTHVKVKVLYGPSRPSRPRAIQ